ncbi:interleukin 12 receptor, beta 2a, like [Anabas testudineus]|uniref:Fibronectin type-III domain-containing protein n=1 Tax=Anabas testudineus TaxID=64144 RepID=A0A3Q1JW00_ANATE|nr:interleukin 12 receptor, beta 2a, like [Anabas testudineus]
MATLRARWLLSILLYSLRHYFAKGSPAPPSDPECFIPCDEKTCHVDIHCTWDPRQDTQILTNYTLHWETRHSEKGFVTSETSRNASIHREDFSSHSELRVWVEAINQYGSAKSQKVVFNNTEDIVKPPPPNIALSHQESLEIEWSSNCDQLHLSVGPCELQHRTEANQVWVQSESGILYSYTLENPQPCTVHEFKVRCACSTGKTSDWSEILKSEEPWAQKAPGGQLDIWRDCGISPAGFDCVLTWKKLPKSQTCGLILGYDVRLTYNNGTVMLMNVSTDGQSGQLVCDGMKCYLMSSLKDVSSVSVSAYNARGATVPAHLALLGPSISCPDCHKSKEKAQQSIDVKMSVENLTVSWNLTSQLFNSLNESVVQYKQVGRPLGQGFDWIKVNKNLTTGIFKGQFNKSTPYNVSVFTVSHNRDVHHFSSLIRYSLEGTPPRVTSFKVLSIAATQVTLSWEPIPLSKQNGVIRCYQIGIDGQNVRNVSPSTQYDNYSFDLKPLNPDQNYEVWIRAVTSAGPGENAITRFKTKQHENDVQLMQILLIIILVFVLLVICFLVVFFRFCRGEKKACPLMPHFVYDKVPDPRNSHIFKNMKHQINDSLAWLCKPSHEPNPDISVLEIVEQPETLNIPKKKTSKLTGIDMSIVEDGCSQMDCQDDHKEDVVTEDCDRTDNRYEREQYSKMVDSDEERDKEREDSDGCSNASEEDEFTSGYEKHFMPTALEILEVS